MTDKLSHINAKGEAHMVDISGKDSSKRIAKAQSCVTMKTETLKRLQAGNLPKGDVFATARIAGIMAAKKCADLIPLCHPLPITGVEIDFTVVNDTTIEITALVKTTGKTGVEMEALTSASIAALTLYDMAKAVDKGIIISETKLLSKSGGKSGDYHADV